jgi:ABC transporter substrate binding protein
MPRGSKPGTKRGGRKRGTPNRRTILADRIFVTAAAHPVAGWQELLSVLMDDQALPADTRLVIAQKSRSAAARSNKARAKTSTTRHNVPAIYEGAQFARRGGLLAYGASFTDMFRRAAGYVDRILRGEKPADLPVQTPTKFEMMT